MSDIPERYRRLAADFTRTVEQVPADRWSSQTPCEEWTALDLVRHVVDSHGLFLGLVGRSLRPAPPVDEDVMAAWISARDQIQADLEDPERAEQTFEGFSGPSTFAAGIDRFICFDLVVHRWDLARATGLDERLDPAEVERLWRVVPAFGEALRGRGAFGPAIEPPPGADEQTRLLSFLGRRV